MASLLAIGISGAGCITQTIFSKSLSKPINSWSLIGSHSINSFDKRLHSNKLSTHRFIYRSLFSSHVISDVLENFSQSSLESLLIFGFATNTLISSVNQLIISLDLLNFEKTTNSLLFLMGDLSSKSWNHVWIGTITVIPALIVGIIRSPKYDILALGRDVASNLGLNTNRVYLEALLVAGFMIGGAISIGGIFPFLGLVLPFIVRQIVGPSLIKLIPIACILAATTTLIVDFISQNIIYPDALYSGVIMALIGSPVFITLLLKQRY